MKDSIIITGGCGLIGWPLSCHLASKGYHIIVVDQKDLPEKVSGVDIVHFDLSSVENFGELKNKLMQFSCCIKGLINNAAFNPKIEDDKVNFDKFENIDLTLWEREMKLNLTSPIFLTRSILEIFDFSDNRNCKVVNVLSTYGIVPPNQNIYKELAKKQGKEIFKPLSYSVAKAALGMFTKFLSVYLAEKSVNVNAIAPGGIENSQDEAFIRSYTDQTPMKRMGRPDDLFGAASYLLSQESNYMTGQTLIVDGGWTVW
jgi:NAD(P)-dependent dehydrogenase (short-subunit alcohol dehydrogenase family)